MTFLTDSSTNSFQLTAFGNVTLNTTIFKYGGGSAYFDGSGYIEAPNTLDLSMGNSEFTIEAWIYPTIAPESGSPPIIIGDSIGSLQIGWQSTTAFGVANAYLVWHFTTTPPPLNEWTHLAVTRENALPNSILRMFYNGIQVASNITSTNYEVPSRFIGGTGGGSKWVGYIDDLRITKGVARYTSDFTPPQQQLINPTETTSLGELLQENSDRLLLEIN